jgi:predicted DsbA family dithiol-disulfide isomerase
VTWSGSARDYESFVARHGLTFPTIDDTAGAIYADLGIPGNPAFGVVNTDQTYEIVMGAVPSDTLDMIITNMLQRS